MKGRRYKQFSEIIMLIYSTSLESKTKRNLQVQKLSLEKSKCFVSEIFRLKDFRQFLQLSSLHTACKVSTRILTRLKEVSAAILTKHSIYFDWLYARLCKRNPDRSSSLQQQNVYFNKLTLDLSAPFCIFFIKKPQTKPTEPFC